ncbi:MAG TPA: NAD(P)H-dependent oxidoreductase [Syntrophomonadaceae bacterium]|nr:NAD(P)H-dependent oxidoreductase [Syntrophomonadaceae bacterium]
MHLLIVYCHPSDVSFTRTLLDSFIRGLKTSKHSYELSDLYRMNFRSDMNEEEYYRESGREADKPLPPDIELEHEKINRADGLVFIYPVWWSDCPAKMKGWFDRVYTLGYAYGCEAGKHFTNNLKRIKKALVICPAGHPLAYLEQIGIAPSMRKTMIDDRLLGVGIQEAQLIILGGTLAQDPLLEQAHLETAWRLGKDF